MVPRYGAAKPEKELAGGAQARRGGGKRAQGRVGRACVLSAGSAAGLGGRAGDSRRVGRACVLHACGRSGLPLAAAAAGPTALQGGRAGPCASPERRTPGHPGAPGRRVMRRGGRRRAGGHGLGIAPLPPLLVWGAFLSQEETKSV